jgi:hypothetical protein
MYTLSSHNYDLKITHDDLDYNYDNITLMSIYIHCPESHHLEMDALVAIAILKYAQLHVNSSNRNNIYDDDEAALAANRMMSEYFRENEINAKLMIVIPRLVYTLVRALNL